LPWQEEAEHFGVHHGKDTSVTSYQFVKKITTLPQVEWKVGENHRSHALMQNG
jgi:hypothetical protein